MSNSNPKEIFCTLGPASINDWVIERLESLGVSLFRVNLSHTKIDRLREVIHEIQRRTSVPICLDTEGAQFRTGDFAIKEVRLKEGAMISIFHTPMSGNESGFNLYPLEMVEKFQVGDLISIDFNSALVQVVRKHSAGFEARVITGGAVGQNKAVNVDRKISMSALTKKDYEALRIGNEMNIRYAALSFAKCGRDVEEIRSVVDKKTFVISKIESYEGIKHLEEIAHKSDALLIDRGDLSRELPIEQIPRAQKEIIAQAKQFAPNIKVYVATNLLESMITSANPTRAEVNDIFNTLIDGADGLVLAAETAIGLHPVRCATMVSKVIQQFSEFSQGDSFTHEGKKSGDAFLLEPHGGTLIERIDFFSNVDEIKKSKKLSVDRKTLFDVEQIALGTYSPLQGFMTRSELESVLENYRLPNGLVWPLPIVLQVTRKDITTFQPGDDVALCEQGSDDIYAVLRVEDIYSYDLSKTPNEIVRTREDNHREVQITKQSESYFLGGKIQLIKKLPFSPTHFSVTPRQVRAIFENKGWNRVAGFYGSGVGGRVHENIQLLAFEKYHCDGLLIHTPNTLSKEGDRSGKNSFECSNFDITKHYPEGKVLLAAFQNFRKPTGPREVAFRALCCKNFGCRYFLMGSDHLEMENDYQKIDVRDLFNSLGNIGIVPLFLDEVLDESPAYTL